VNGTVYYEKWSKVQTQFFDPQCAFGNNAFSTNRPNYQARGAKLQLIVRIPVR